MQAGQSLPGISIVDDDQLMRDLDEAAGGNPLRFAVATFPSAIAFLKSPDLDETSCLIADVQMPGMTGDELYRHLVGDGRAIPTILVTAYPNDRVRARAISDGVVCYIHKPFDQNNLMSCVRKALEFGSAAPSLR